MIPSLEDEALAFVKELNVAWTKGAAGTLASYFHPKMVAIAPTERNILYGQDACVAGWQNFASNATIHHWAEIDPQVSVFGNTAIVTYYFDMSFDIQGQTVSLRGRDMFVLAKEEGRWWAVADQFSPMPSN